MSFQEMLAQLISSCDVKITLNQGKILLILIDKKDSSEFRYSGTTLESTVCTAYYGG